MSHSSQYYQDPINHDQNYFNDSVVIKPISLKPSVISSMASRINPQNKQLGIYDQIKLTQYIEQQEQGRIIELISIDQNSLTTQLTQQGLQFLQRYSAQDITFVTITGQNCSGKSFFLDKILNLTNVQGNNFCLQYNKPSLKIWSIPFVKQEFKFFIAEICNCSPGQKQFERLLAYATLFSSIILNFQSFKQQKPHNNSISKLSENIKKYKNVFYSSNQSQQNQVKQDLDHIFPHIIYHIKRFQQNQINKNNGVHKIDELNYASNSQKPDFSNIILKQFYLPNAKNKSYAGLDQDLKDHSFLNKKCIQQSYIRKISQIFSQIIKDINQKKHRQLVFNGGILLKYIKHLLYYINNNKKINITELYYEIIKQLYISAYNYCVICYHQLLEQSLSNQKPRSIDQLLDIFQHASNTILDKYNEFSLNKQLHEQYQEKLLKHIESKQKLILEINRKKTDLQLTKLYEQNIDINNFNQVWNQIVKVNKQNPTYTHGKDQILGKKLKQIIDKLKTGNNVDYRIMKQIQKIKMCIDIRKKQLTQILSSQQAKSKEINQTKKQKQRCDAQIANLDQKIKELKKEIKVYQQIDNYNPTDRKQDEQKLIQKVNRNEQLIQNILYQNSLPIQNNKDIVNVTKQIQTVKSKIQLYETTLKEIKAAEPKNNAGEGQQKKQIKMKKEQQKEKPPVANNTNKRPSADSKIKQSIKNSKKSGK